MKKVNKNIAIFLGQKGILIFVKNMFLTVFFSFLTLFPLSVHAEPSPVTQECLIAASRKYLVPIDIILAVLAVERGRIGEVSQNRNGTVDIGPMQINTVHFNDAARFGIKYEELRDNGCLNVFFGTWYLSELLEKHETWEAIGIYHSRTPEIKRRYQYRTWQRFSELNVPKLLQEINTPKK